MGTCARPSQQEIGVVVLRGIIAKWYPLQDEVRTFCIAPDPEVRLQMEQFKLVISGTALDLGRELGQDASNVAEPVEAGEEPAVIVPRSKSQPYDRVVARHRTPGVEHACFCVATSGVQGGPDSS